MTISARWARLGAVTFAVIVVPMVGVAAARPNQTSPEPGESAPPAAMVEELGPTASASPSPNGLGLGAPLPGRPAHHTIDEAGRWSATSLDVPFISQLPDMPSGCEATSVAMLLQYAGADVTKEQVAEEMPYSDDPELGFQGSPYDYTGGIIFPPALLDLVSAHLGSAVDLTGAGYDALTSYLDAGKPVVVWFYPEPANSHTVVVTGYSATEVWINDPAEGLIDPYGYIPDSPGTGKNLAMPLGDFVEYWQSSGYRALSY